MSFYYYCTIRYLFVLTYIHIFKSPIPISSIPKLLISSYGCWSILFYLRVSSIALTIVLISQNVLFIGWIMAWCLLFGFCSPHLHRWTPPPLLLPPTAMTTRKTTAETTGRQLNPSLHWWPHAHAKESLKRCPSENSCKAIYEHLRTHCTLIPIHPRTLFLLQMLCAFRVRKYISYILHLIS